MKKRLISMASVIMITVATLIGTTACRHHHGCNHDGKCDKEMCSDKCKGKCDAKDCKKEGMDSCCMKGMDKKDGMKDSMQGMKGMDGKKECCMKKDEKK